MFSNVKINIEFEFQLKIRIRKYKSFINYYFSLNCENRTESRFFENRTEKL